jgi:late competence protein required for DNA uptake (superfamily II DNA/RNA helicase)
MVPHEFFKQGVGSVFLKRDVQGRAPFVIKTIHRISNFEQALDESVILMCGLRSKHSMHSVVQES